MSNDKRNEDVKRRITIKDIANIANVSSMTVSRVINGHPNVKKETREKVLNIIKEYDYHPNPHPRSSTQKPSKMLGLIVADINNFFFCELARGVEDKAYERGYSLIISSTDDLPERAERYVNLLLKSGVDGIIYGSSRLKEPVVEKLISDRFPLVFVARKLATDDYNYVVLDNFKGAYDITSHLLDLGYRRIAIITGHSNISTGLDRLNGYKEALRKRGIKPEPSFIAQGPFTRRTGYSATQKLLSLKTPPEAIFGGNDYVAMGIIDAIADAGMHIPEDIAVVGFDDTIFSKNKRIQLTTINHRQYQMGSLASQILIDYIEMKEKHYTHRIILEPQLILRESCGRNLKDRSIERLRLEV